MRYEREIKRVAKKWRKAEKMIIATAHLILLSIIYLYFKHYQLKWRIMYDSKLFDGN